MSAAAPVCSELWMRIRRNRNELQLWEKKTDSIHSIVWLTLDERRNRVRRERCWSTAGVPRPGTGSLHPVAIRAAVEATRLLKPLVQRVARRLGERAGRNVSER